MKKEYPKRSKKEENLRADGKKFNITGNPN